MKLINRYLTDAIKEDLEEKMVFVGGPRQAGKTTLALDCVGKDYNTAYFNWDKVSQRLSAINSQWPSDKDLIILDEFHKYKKWKNWIKGEWDTLKKKYKFLLTGSARFNIYRKGGDSLQGRYHYYTLHPFTFAELINTNQGKITKVSRNFNTIQPGNELIFQNNNSKKDLDTIFHYGGFPEPLFKQDERFLRRWHKEKFERFFKEDIRELTQITDITTIMLLSELLPERTSSILSINSLSEDLQVNYRTVANWINIFEQFYYCFTLPPYRTSKISSVRKEKKLYLWDWSGINDDGKRLENFIACHLLKFCDFLREYEGYDTMLYYLRDTNAREVDFLVAEGQKPWFAVEVKLSETNISKNLLYFNERMKMPYCYQVVKDRDVDFNKSNIRVMSANKFLSGLK